MNTDLHIQSDSRISGHCVNYTMLSIYVDDCGIYIWDVEKARALAKEITEGCDHAERLWAELRELKGAV